MTFNNGAVGTVASATATALTVTITTPPTAAGPLTAIVAVGGVSSGAAVQVATVRPVVTTNSANLSAAATSITIAGYGFSTTLASNSVTFDNGAVGTVTAATANSLTVTFSTMPTRRRDLNATVTVNSW
ncbi:MAG: hypothetical protein U0892_16280 [Pirellulales bacterium]